MLRRSAYRSSFWIGLGTLAALNVVQADEQPPVLTRGAESLCRIVAAPEDRLAADSLQAAIRRLSDAKVPIVLPQDAAGGGSSCEILLGTAGTNKRLSEEAGRCKVDIAPETLTSDGYIVQTLKDGDRGVVLAAGGGKRGVFYAVGELKNYCLRRSGDAVVVLPAAVREIPVFKYRWFWTWDWRMEWGATEPGGDKMGGGGHYTKKPESFLADYKPCIDFMAENGLNGLIIWGFVRDAHGGAAASQELCNYASDRGVEILPGVGTSGYSGYFFEGDHLYNGDTWVKKHPDLRAVEKDGKPRNAPCPSNKANQDWLDAGAKWLFETFRIGGVNLEMGDFFVCHCRNCKQARASIQSTEPDYYKDMAVSHMVTLKTMRKLAPQAWLSYATYTGFDRKMMDNPPKFIEMISSDSICQWTLTNMIRKNQWPPDLKPMTAHSVGYLHWANKSTHTERDFFLEPLRDAALRSRQSGLEGLVLYGELPDTWPNMQLNYLAFREYCFHPDMTREEFTTRRLAPLFGKDLTSDLWKVIDSAANAASRKNTTTLESALSIARAAMNRARPDMQPRWKSLTDHIARDLEDRSK